jgi:hypothetical protein
MWCPSRRRCFVVVKVRYDGSLRGDREAKEQRDARYGVERASRAGTDGRSWRDLGQVDAFCTGTGQSCSAGKCNAGLEGTAEAGVASNVPMYVQAASWVWKQAILDLSGRRRSY